MIAEREAVVAEMQELKFQTYMFLMRITQRDIEQEINWSGDDLCMPATRAETDQISEGATKVTEELLECLFYAHVAIRDAIWLDDGLDNEAGKRVALMIEEQFKKHGVAFVPL